MPAVFVKPVLPQSVLELEQGQPMMMNLRTQTG
jgi:hypothetical protein